MAILKTGASSSRGADDSAGEEGRMMIWVIVIVGLVSYGLLMLLENEDRK